ncbi:MAG: bifunctional 5,10-methylenetetrahydrofolate dehydrogenase/5,10-methenyltetrahydrofolate cyclohydrolase [Patescibacteria group bacterium]|nr:bifunctional 5,10-methylenetetrahydrofolate dehydrogenase/5,10-methenyltetrahydrofolate cyclohydrolase [Patescibacteria group bacterium]MDD4610592.1 bifunctional 5,10-methylenetetrahydrofolate dehydrogenase/5,10-methenyltetrahydrofolate cyclohydrolase [Patescibacteria group bacterium]
MQIIDGKKIAEKIKDQVTKKIFALKEARPNLAIILVGEREDSKLYVNMKEREAKKVGIDTHIYRCEADISEVEIIKTIEFLNNDNLIDAILVQLPLPSGFDTDKIIAKIDPKKDVDCFHPENVKILLSTCNHEEVIPPLIKVVLEILGSIKCNLVKKKVCVIANSDIFGKSMAKVLECRGAEVEITASDQEDLKNKTCKADILITAIGKPKFIKKDFIKKDAVVIDIGITKEGEKVFGDVDFEDVKDTVGFITPVPGGVGPMTIAMLFKNTLELYKRRHEL